MFYKQITSDNLVEIFSDYGHVHKVIIFKKSFPCAIVELENEDAA